MPLVVYLDETGDHSLTEIDPGYPIFGVVMFVCDSNVYCRNIIPSVYGFKFEQFGHESVILHSSKIRRARGDFSFLINPVRRQPFYEGINHIMSANDYKLLGMFIRKEQHKQKYGTSARNPYDLALTFALERLVFMLESVEQSEVKIVAESRGNVEDGKLLSVFHETVKYGTYYVKRERFAAIDFNLEFVKKEANVVGMQMADLAAYPIARHIIDSNRSHPSYPIVEKKIYKGRGWGLKIFP
jgi:hypothetical protein